MTATQERPVVFVAHGVTGLEPRGRHSTTPSAVRAALRDSGWTVRPAEELEPGAAPPPVASVLEANVAAIAQADLAVFLTADVSDLSSVWVEIGLALAFGVRCAIVCGPGQRLPFLVVAALDDRGTGENPIAARFDVSSTTDARDCVTRIHAWYAT